jgi:alkenylglycerophosphocholine/alkenylglycerophosphoethanolamine hydrolase
MTSPFAWVVGAGAVAGAVHLGAHYAGRQGLAGLAKAAPIALLLAWVLAHGPAVGEGYRRLLAAGLLFSMGGDLLLLSPERFRAGLASFFVGHVCYTLAFLGGSAGFVPAGAWLLPLGVAAGAVLRVLWRHAPRERLPIACYVAMITLMAWSAIGRGIAPATPQPSGVLAALGAVLFMASDTILALDRFVARWRGAHAVVMLTYYGAQTLLAASVAA